jgi:anti-sigma regulatory factor (Ser/Thr protein kinase)
MQDDQIIQLNIPADFKYLNVVGACLTAILQHEEDLPTRDIVTTGVELAVHETCINIIEHAYAGAMGRITLSIQILNDPHRLEVKIKDQGSPFVLPEIQPPQVEGDIQIRGYGLFLVHELMDQVVYVPKSGNNTWHLIKKL